MIFFSVLRDYLNEGEYMYILKVISYRKIKPSYYHITPNIQELEKYTALSEFES